MYHVEIPFETNLCLPIRRLCSNEWLWIFVWNPGPVDMKDAFWPTKSDMEVLTDQRKPSIHFNISIHLNTFGIYRLDITCCMIKVDCYIFLSFLKCSRFIFNFSCLFGKGERGILGKPHAWDLLASLNCPSKAWLVEGLYKPRYTSAMKKNNLAVCSVTWGIILPSYVGIITNGGHLVVIF